MLAIKYWTIQFMWIMGRIMTKILTVVLLFVSLSSVGQKMFFGHNLLPPITETDTTVLICGKWYKKVKIGTQTWLAENLYCDDGEGGIYSYNDEADISNVYGYLYTWDAAMRVAASVDGWHLPSDAEWTTLSTYLGGTSIAGGKLKETGTDHWLSPNTGATNESGFTALPGGIRYHNDTFDYIGSRGHWWSATEYSTNSAWYLRTNYNNSNLNRFSLNKTLGFSVRLIKD